MFFRFGSAIVLAVLISLAGVALEKRNLEYRRQLSRQRFRMDVLVEAHAKLRLETQQLGAPVHLIDAMESGKLEFGKRLPDDEASEQASPRQPPLLRWQRVTP